MLHRTGHVISLKTYVPTSSLLSWFSWDANKGNMNASQRTCNSPHIHVSTERLHNGSQPRNANWIHGGKTPTIKLWKCRKTPCHLFSEWHCGSTIWWQRAPPASKHLTSLHGCNTKLMPRRFWSDTKPAAVLGAESNYKRTRNVHMQLAHGSLSVNIWL